MRYSFVSIVFASMVMMGCTQTSEIPLDEENNFDIVKGLIMEPMSRTSMGDDGSVLWKKDDAISIFLSTGYHHKYVLSTGDGKTSGVFAYSNQVTNSNKQNSHYAVYPFSENHTLDAEGKISVDLSSWANQNYTQASFEDDKALMTGKSENTEFSFYNAASMARFELSSNVPGSYSITSISLSSESMPLNGNATVDMTQVKPSVTCSGTEEANKTNTLTCAEPVMLEENPIVFYVLIPPGTYSALQIKVVGKDELNNQELLWETTLSEPVIFERSNFKTFKKEFEASDFSGNIENN